MLSGSLTESSSVAYLSAEVLKKGGLVQIFPEGMERYDGQVGPFFQSYLVIAHRGNAPIIPIVIALLLFFFVHEKTEKRETVQREYFWKNISKLEL